MFTERVKTSAPPEVAEYFVVIMQDELTKPNAMRQGGWLEYQDGYLVFSGNDEAAFERAQVVASYFLRGYWLGRRKPKQ